MHIPRLIVTGTAGGSGKTLVSLGLCRALSDRGLRVKAFKKGPDYIDAAWLGLAARGEAVNLDPHFLSPGILRALFYEKSLQADLCLIEGNRGLYDGFDAQGSCSTAALSRTLNAPIILVLDATKMTRTAAAIVKGLACFEEGVHIGGVILNRVAGPRHERVLRESIEQFAGIPVLGALPKISQNPIPERHMGLTSFFEHEQSQHALGELGALIAKHVDLDAVSRLAASSCDFDALASPMPVQACTDQQAPRIGYVHDAVLWFYYGENLELLSRAGACLTKLSLLSDEPWPEIDGLYLGGGFPEMNAAALAQSPRMRDLKALADKGVPVYAECGGLMVLCDSLCVNGEHFPMASVLPLACELCERPVGLGYTQAQVTGENPFFAPGEVVIGHEFHYSRCELLKDHPAAASAHCVLSMERGVGLAGGFDGMLVGGVMASYTHIHGLAQPNWALRFVAAAKAYRLSRG